MAVGQRQGTVSTNESSGGFFWLYPPLIFGPASHCFPYFNHVSRVVLELLYSLLLFGRHIINYIWT